MVDYILGEIVNIYNAIADFGSSSNLTTTLEGFNRGISDGINVIRSNVITPVAYTILALFLLLELQNIASRIEGQHGILGAELPIKALIKMVICKVIIDEIGLIMNAFYEVSLYIIKKISSILGDIGALEIGDNILKLREAIDSYGFGEKLLLASKVGIIGIVVSLIMTIVKVVIIARFIEIFIFIAISPIPVATLPHSEMSSIAKNFFKSFAAVCMHGVLIYIILAMFPLLLNSAILGKLGGSADLSAELWKMCGYSLVLAISVIASGRWAKSMFNAM